MDNAFSSTPGRSQLSYMLRSISHLKLNLLLIARAAAVALPLTSSISFADEAEPKLPSQIQVERLRGELGAAPSGMLPRAIPPLALDLVKHFEGWVASPYDDAVGYCTVGYGHLIALDSCDKVRPTEYGDGLSDEEGELLLLEDISFAQLAVQRLVSVPVSDDQFGALVAFVYNVGEGNFQRSTLRSKLNLGQIEPASSEFLRWVRANGKILPGLQARRACEKTLYDEELSYNANGQFDRRNCVELGAAPSGAEAIDIYSGE